MRDQSITCAECGSRFAWTAGEQRFYAQRGLSAPKRCPECRARHRQERKPWTARQRSVRRAAASQGSFWPPTRTSAGVLRPALLGLGFAALATLVLWRWARLETLLSWALAINLVAFLTWGYDKGAARLEVARVPEKVLLGLALVGGTLGAVVGMAVFRHKSAKTGFRVRLLLVVAAQAVLIGLYYLWRTGP